MKYSLAFTSDAITLEVGSDWSRTLLRHSYPHTLMCVPAAAIVGRFNALALMLPDIGAPHYELDEAVEYPGRSCPAISDWFDHIERTGWRATDIRSALGAILYNFKEVIQTGQYCRTNPLSKKTLMTPDDGETISKSTHNGTTSKVIH